MDGVKVTSGGLYSVQVSPTRVKLFMSQELYEQYVDFQTNGLRMTRQSHRTSYFNDGARLVDVSLEGETPKRYVLHRDSRMFRDERYLKKYIELISEGGEQTDAN